MAMKRSNSLSFHGSRVWNIYVKIAGQESFVVKRQKQKEKKEKKCATVNKIEPDQSLVKSS